MNRKLNARSNQRSHRGSVLGGCEIAQILTNDGAPYGSCTELLLNDKTSHVKRSEPYCRIRTPKAFDKKKLGIALAISTSALFITAANAAPLSSSSLSIAPNNGVENVRVVCDQSGQCFRTRGARRVVIQRDYDSYNYAPREGYIERRGYYGGGYYNEGTRVGIGIGRGGLGIGFGAGPRW